MDHALIDITSATFWLIVGAAAFLLAPIRHVELRRVCLLVVNLGFLYLVLNVWVVPLLIGLLAVHIALWMISKGHYALATGVGDGCCTAHLPSISPLPRAQLPAADWFPCPTRPNPASSLRDGESTEKIENETRRATEGHGEGTEKK